MITASLATDFGGNLNPAKLKQEIEANVGITTALDYINVSGDVVNIYFVSTLSAGEITVLNAIIAAHVSGTSPYIVVAATGTKNTITTITTNQTANRILTLPSGDLVSKNSTQTLTNKTISSTNNTISLTTANVTGVLPVSKGGTGVSTLAAGFILQGSGTNPILSTLVAPSGTVVGTTDAQILTNKTITTAANTLQIDGTSVTVGTRSVNVGGTGAGSLASGFILRGAGTGAITATLAAPTGTIVGISDTQALTNKTISSGTVPVQLLRSVAIDSATPSVGQTLVTTSATTATWQNLLGIIWRGAWNSGTAYVVNDATQYLGVWWICISNNTNQAPPNANWNQLIDGINWKGAWDSGTSYRVDDYVSSAGVIYICVLENIDQIPPNANWNVFASSFAVAGSDTQVQYNNAGVVGGASKLTIDTDGYPIIGDYVGTTYPTAPTSGLKLFTQLRAGVQNLATIDKLSRVDLIQSSLYSYKVGLWSATGSGTGLFLMNFDNNATGTATTRAVATTNSFTYQRRIGYVSAATAGSSAGTRHGLQQFFRGDITNMSGFLYVARFGISSASTVANQRAFVGLIASTAVIGNVNPSTLINILGFGFDSADSQWTFMHNDGSGSAVKEPLTGTFPTQSLSINMMEARIYAQSNTNNIYYSLSVQGGSFYESVITTDIPVAFAMLSPQIWTNNGTTALACGIDIVLQYIETYLY